MKIELFFSLEIVYFPGELLTTYLKAFPLFHSEPQTLSIHQLLFHPQTSSPSTNFLPIHLLLPSSLSREATPLHPEISLLFVNLLHSETPLHLFPTSRNSILPFPYIQKLNSTFSQHPGTSPTPSRNPKSQPTMEAQDNPMRVLKKSKHKTIEDLQKEVKANQSGVTKDWRLKEKEKQFWKKGEKEVGWCETHRNFCDLDSKCKPMDPLPASSAEGRSTDIKNRCFSSFLSTKILSPLQGTHSHV